MTTTNKRYLVVQNPTIANFATLNLKGFKELSDAVHPSMVGAIKLFVDTKLINFWKVDDNTLKSTEKIIKQHYEDIVHPIKSEELLNHI